MTQTYELPVERWLKFLSTQAGRDKLYRFVQYFGRFLAYTLQRGGRAPEMAARLAKLSAAVGLGRKLFRMGKPLDFLQTLLKSLNVPDDVLRWGTVIKCTGYGGWLVLDAIQWLQSVGVLSLEKSTMASINQTAPRLWFLGILASLVVNLHKIQKNFLQRQMEMRLLLQGTPQGGLAKVLDKEMRKVTRDALQDMIDLVIPLSLMGWIDVSAGTVGLAGAITSVMGAAAIYPSN